MSARLEAIKTIGKRKRSVPEAEQIRHLVQFATHVFHQARIEELTKKTARNWLDVIEGKGTFDPDGANEIAEALKNWAIRHGATHFTHWFQPLTNGTAEKHDSFLNWGPNGSILEKLSGKDLMKGEPDASSFPTGGLRNTHQARGYTVWDPTSFPFLWEGGDGVTLCIPALFFSWKGAPLDHKIPLLRSEEKLNQVASRLLQMGSIPAGRVFSTLGVEQEYFAIDRSLFVLRSDLLLAGRTVFGASPAKGQELGDHYLGPLNDRIMAYMREFEDAALHIGIPVKTRHNEVAPAQHEVAPLFERASIAIDHNIQLMELMREVGLKHDIACLFHEKPFKGLNGSGKHNNWSLATDTGINLLEPQGNRFVFLTLLTAVIRAIYHHGPLLRGSVASVGNDYRLGGAEAPSPIASIYLGEALEKIIEEILHEKLNDTQIRNIDLGLLSLLPHEADLSDRNRTAFFAFTGNKFEFRAVGASAHCALPICVINAIVADSLQLILDELAGAIGDQELKSEELLKVALPVLRKYLSEAQPILFNGDNYSLEWEEESAKRGLPNTRKSFDALSAFIDKKTVAVFKGILSEEELQSRYDIMVEQYAKTMNIELNLMIDLFQTQILPAAQKDFILRGMQQKFAPIVESAMEMAEELKTMQGQLFDLGWEAKGKVFAELLSPKMEAFRERVDQLEKVVDNTLWPLPKYRELLYLI